jgi:hypothetical protein
MLYLVEYYIRPTGRCPIKKWIDQLVDYALEASVRKRIELLETEDPELLVDDGILVPVISKSKKIKNIPGFYELKDRGKKWRIAVYHDLEKGVFVLLHGWRRSEDTDNELAIARTLLDEYKRGRK